MPHPVGDRANTMPSTIYQPNMKTVKVAPAPESASSSPTQDGGEDESVNSSLVRTGLRPILLLQAALGVGRAHFTAPGVWLLQRTYAVAIAAALLYQNIVEKQYIFVDVPAGTLSHLRVLTWCDLVECFTYIIFGTFFNRAKLASIIRKLDGVDATMGLKGDAALALSTTLRNSLTACCVLFFNAILVLFVFLSSQHVNFLSISIVCRIVHDSELSYFTAAVDGINYRLRVFDWHVQELPGASERTVPADAADGKEWAERSVWRRVWWSVFRQPGLESRARPSLEVQRLWRVYTDIVDSADMFNDTISAQILLSAVSSFCHILVTVHLNLMRKQENAQTSSMVGDSAWLAVYLGAVVVRYLVNHVRACAGAETSKSLSRLINQHVHRRLCDPALEEGSRRGLETLALLTSRRPVRYTVYRVFSLDLSLPLSFFYLCITYIIVLVQFAKL